MEIFPFTTLGQAYYLSFEVCSGNDDICKDANQSDMTKNVTRLRTFHLVRPFSTH